MTKFSLEHLEHHQAIFYCDALEFPLDLNHQIRLGQNFLQKNQLGQDFKKKDSTGANKETYCPELDLFFRIWLGRQKKGDCDVFVYVDVTGTTKSGPSSHRDSHCDLRDCFCEAGCKEVASHKI